MSPSIFFNISYPFTLTLTNFRHTCFGQQASQYFFRVRRVIDFFLFIRDSQSCNFYVSVKEYLSQFVQREIGRLYSANLFCRKICGTMIANQLWETTISPNKHYPFQTRGHFQTLYNFEVDTCLCSHLIFVLFPTRVSMQQDGFFFCCFCICLIYVFNTEVAAPALSA